MGYAANHYTYQNIVDPNRTRPSKPASKVPPRLTPAQKAEAVARILAVKTEIETREAKTVQEITDAAAKLRAAQKGDAQSPLDLAEAKKVIRAAQNKVAREKYNAKIAAEADLARDAVLALQSTQHRNHSAKSYHKRKNEAHLVRDLKAGVPTALELVDEAARAELIERVEARKAKKRERGRIREQRKKEQRHAEKRARLDAEAAEVEAQLRALLVNEERVLAFEAYIARSQTCREAYYHKIGRPLGEEEDKLKERAVKARLLQRLKDDPTFLDTWRVSRWLGSVGSPVPLDPASRKAYNVEKNDRLQTRKLRELVGRRDEVEAKIAELASTSQRKWAIEQCIRRSIHYGQRWRKQANLPEWTADEVDLATLRAKARIVDRVAIETDYLDRWYDTERTRRTKVTQRKLARIKADPARANQHRHTMNASRNEWRKRKRAEKLAAEAENPTPPPPVDDAAYEKSLRRLTRIFNEARREVAKKG